MGDVMLALARTFASLRDGKVWLYVLTPALFSLLLSIGLAVWALGAVVQQMMDYPPMTLLVGWGLVWLANILAYLGGWMAIFAIAYLTASLLAAVVILPLMLNHLSANEYRDVAAMGKDSFVAAAMNSLVASVVFVLAWVATIPLWLIPGFSLLIPLLLMGWLNRRTFAYDALSMHASDSEWQAIRQRPENAALHARPDHGPARPYPCRRLAGAGAGGAIIRPLPGWKPCAARAAARWSLSRENVYEPHLWRHHHWRRDSVRQAAGQALRQNRRNARCARPAPELGGIPGRRPPASGRDLQAHDGGWRCGLFLRRHRQYAGRPYPAGGRRGARRRAGTARRSRSRI